MSIVACLMQPNCPKMRIGFGIQPLVIRLIFELRKALSLIIHDTLVLLRLIKIVDNV